jgi:hypothetical protein
MRIKIQKNSIGNSCVRKIERKTITIFILKIEHFLLLLLFNIFFLWYTTGVGEKIKLALKNSSSQKMHLKEIQINK